MTKRSVGKVLEQIALDELHEGGGVGVDVVRAGGVEVRVARAETWIIAGTSSSTIFS
jgi:hypothetical protein